MNIFVLQCILLPKDNENMKKKRIALTCGGTQGHIIPAIELKELLGEDVILFGSSQVGKAITITATPMPNILTFIPTVFKLTVSTCKAIFHLLTKRIDHVIGFGSYHTLPVVLAAILCRKKLSFFEANCSLGLLHRIFSPFATIYSQFPLIDNIPYTLVKRRPWNQPNIDSKCKSSTILVYGGSQGSLFINKIWIEYIQKNNPQMDVIHLTGYIDNPDRIKKSYTENNMKSLVKTYDKNMPLIYAETTIAICRGGAGTIAELIENEIPAIIIPYPYDRAYHQKYNADFFCDVVKGGLLLEQFSYSSKKFENLLSSLLQHLDKFKANIVSYKKSDNIPPLHRIILNEG